MSCASSWSTPHYLIDVVEGARVDIMPWQGVAAQV
jgi:hypothetical protein